MRENESVSIRATTAGITSIAATSVTPITVNVAKIDKDRMIINWASTRPTRTPETLATSGSNVVNNSAR